MAEVESFRKCVEKCPDKSKLVIVNNWTNPEIATQCDEFEKLGSEVHRHPENIGCSGAMNIGVNKLGEGLDFVIILSPSALFTNSVEDFVRVIENTERIEKNYFYWSIAKENLAQPGTRTDMHAFAITKRCFDEVGNYDENYYPVYYDDADYGYRMGRIGATKTPVDIDRISQDLGGGVGKDKKIFDLYWANVNHLHDYYVRKWGGEIGNEKFTHPYNDEKLTIRDWKLERDLITWKI